MFHCQASSPQPPLPPWSLRNTVRGVREGSDGDGEETTTASPLPASFSFIVDLFILALITRNSPPWCTFTYSPTRLVLVAYVLRRNTPGRLQVLEINVSIALPCAAHPLDVDALIWVRTPKAKGNRRALADPGECMFAYAAAPLAWRLAGCAGNLIGQGV